MCTKSLLATVLAAATLVTGAAAAGSAYTTHAADGNDVKVSGCVIRFSEEYPTIHANGAHMCAGISSVAIDSTGAIQVQQTVRGAGQNPVLFAIAQGDETWAARGLIVGASGGTDDTRYYVHDTRLGRKLNLNNPADYDRVQGEVSNIWIGHFHTTWGN